MATVILEAKKRENIGTGSSRADRRAGLVPCVVYGDNQPSENICIEKDLLSRYVYKSNFFSTVPTSSQPANLGIQSVGISYTFPVYTLFHRFFFMTLGSSLLMV